MVRQSKSGKASHPFEAQRIWHFAQTRIAVILIFQIDSKIYVNSSHNISDKIHNAFC